MLLVDSCVWIDLLRDRDTNETIRLQQMANTGRLAVPDIVLAEILIGASDERNARVIADKLAAFPVVWIGGSDLAVQTGRNYRHLRAMGITIRSTIDCLLATFCIANGHELLTSDRDFRPFAHHFGLRLA